MIEFKNFFDTQEIESNQLDTLFNAISAEKEKIGYYDLPAASQLLVAEVENLRPEIDKRFHTIAVVGIGGSSLGIKAIDRLLRPDTPNAKKIVFFENSDPISINHEMAKLDKRHTLFVVISKSGGTVETLSIFKRLIVSFDFNLNDAENIMVISDEGSILSQFADHHRLRRFVIPDNVGGRFSVLSAVGIVPLVLAGFDAKGILQGAGNFLERFWNRQEEHLLHKASYYVKNAEHLSMNVLFAYSDTFEEFGKWMVQLWGESLGKRNKQGERVGLTPISLIGSVDQHSFLQLIIEGPLNKTVTFMHIESSQEELMIPELSLEFLGKSDFVNGKSFNDLINAQCMATLESVVKSGVSVDEIIWKVIDPKSVGEMIIYYELLTSASGVLLDINPYDQPGVELGKQILQGYFQS